jgi:hypothetical protein
MTGPFALTLLGVASVKPAHGGPPRLPSSVSVNLSLESAAEAVIPTIA